MSERRLLVCYGGTFDPVHLGHVGAARDVLALTGCEELRVIPAAVPPHRETPGAEPAHRLAMLELAFAGIGGVRVDTLELQREGPSYTVDTLTAIRREVGPEVALGFVLGTDAFAGLERWHRHEALTELAHLLVLARPGHALPREGPVAEVVRTRRVDAAGALRASPAGALWCVPQTPVEVSATAVRATLQAARERPAAPEVTRLLSPAVWAYIRREGLYGVPRARIVERNAENE